jgi:hypothetical protein
MTIQCAYLCQLLPLAGCCCGEPVSVHCVHFRQLQKNRAGCFEARRLVWALGCLHATMRVVYCTPSRVSRVCLRQRRSVAWMVGLSHRASDQRRSGVLPRSSTNRFTHHAPPISALHTTSTTTPHILYQPPHPTYYTTHHAPHTTSITTPHILPQPPRLTYYINHHAPHITPPTTHHILHQPPCDTINYATY